jgi:hypothetical protein
MKYLTEVLSVWLKVWVEWKMLDKYVSKRRNKGTKTTLALKSYTQWIFPSFFWIESDLFDLIYLLCKVLTFVQTRKQKFFFIQKEWTATIN